MATAMDFAAGASTAQVATRYRVSRMSAWRWRRDFQAGGVEALRSRGPASRRRLTERELGLLQELLKAGPLPCTAGKTNGGRWGGCVSW
jgi:transposase